MVSIAWSLSKNFQNFLKLILISIVENRLWYGFYGRRYFHSSPRKNFERSIELKAQLSWVTFPGREFFPLFVEKQPKRARPVSMWVYRFVKKKDLNEKTSFLPNIVFTIMTYSDLSNWLAYRRNATGFPDHFSDKVYILRIMALFRQKGFSRLLGVPFSWNKIGKSIILKTLRFTVRGDLRFLTYRRVVVPKGTSDDSILRFSIHL